MLTIELVPKTSWFTNLRSELRTKDWDKLRKEAYQKANYCCQICEGKGNKRIVECHEIWDYDDKNKIQKLTGVTALCPSCHEVKHIGMSRIRGLYEKAKSHLMKINNLDKDKAEEYINQQFQIWEERSQYDWVCDISWLESVNIQVKSKLKQEGKKSK